MAQVLVNRASAAYGGVRASSLTLFVLLQNLNMSPPKKEIIIIVLLGLVSGISGLLGNIASSVIPKPLIPYIWLSWPLFLVFTVVGIGLVIRQQKLNGSGYSTQQSIPESSNTEGQIFDLYQDHGVSMGNPKQSLVRLTPELFESLGFTMSQITRLQMQSQYDFYYLAISIFMRPRRYMHFTFIELALDFGPKGADEPIIHSIFPESRWVTVISAGGSIQLSLDGNLEFNAESRATGVEEDVEHVPIKEFNYNLNRAIILASGQGGSKCFWRIDDAGFFQEESVLFGVVIKIPKGTSVITLEGFVTAEAVYPTLLAPLPTTFKELKENYLSGFKKRYESRKTWSLDLPISGLVAITDQGFGF